MAKKSVQSVVKNVTSNALSSLEEMLNKSGFEFKKKGSSFTLIDPDIIIYYDSVGREYTALEAKDGKQVHANKFLGGMKKFLDSKRADQSKVVDVNTKEVKKSVKAGAVSTSTEKTKTVTKRSNGQSKTDAAREIFKKMIAKKDVARKDVIEAFIKEVGLTKAGASTYYQNFVKVGVK